MSLDTKYRPVDFDDVLGQPNITTILRRIIVTGAGFHQSYLFAGPFGSGKTTLGRIMARALLCSHPTPNGDPCNQCPTCKDILETGVSETFIEVDAATNSGKADMQKLKQDLEYSSFSGKRKLYLLDEAHQLSRESLDSALKPLEDNIPGSNDKRLVCIFCTTEPEKMRNTIISRCAPAFIIQPTRPQVIAERLAYICQQEKIPYQQDALLLLAELTELHIRDAIKALEGISLVGEVNRENVFAYLHLDLNGLFLDVSENLLGDFKVVAGTLKTLASRMSPISCYARIIDLLLLSYKVHLGAVSPPAHWDTERVKKLGTQYGDKLVECASYLSRRPGKPTQAMLECDLFHLSRLISGRLSAPSEQVVVQQVVQQQVLGAPVEKQLEKQPEKAIILPPVQETVHPKDEKSCATPEKSGIVSTMKGTRNGVFVDPRGVKGMIKTQNIPHETPRLDLGLPRFCELLALRVEEMLGETGSGGSARRLDMGGSGADPSR